MHTTTGSPRLSLGPQSEAGCGPDLTPIIDIMVSLMAVLLLLMPATQLVLADLNLTELNAATASTVPTEPPVTISILPNGDLRWDDQPVSLEALADRLVRTGAGASERDQATRFLIAGDRDCSLGRIVEVWNVVTSAGHSASLVATPAPSTN